LTLSVPKALAATGNMERSVIDLRYSRRAWFKKWATHRRLFLNIWTATSVGTSLEPKQGRGLKLGLCPHLHL